MAIGAISAVFSGYERPQLDGKKELSEEEHKQVNELKKRDQEVKAHEAAHIAAGGSCVRGGASYSYQNGPDGRRYAVGGEVSIDTSGVSGDLEATIQKMRLVRRAALAPANPSAQDRSVASAAASAEAKAQQELVAQRKNESAENSSEKTPLPEDGTTPEQSAISDTKSCYFRTGKKGSDPPDSSTLLNVYV